MRCTLALFLSCSLLACSSADATSPVNDAVDSAHADVAMHDAAQDVADSNETNDAADAAEVDPNACSVFGAPGECMTTSACAALGDHTSYAGHCPGASTIECCIKTPNVADNPPTPTGYKLMQQSEVTPDMTSWAVAILNDPVTYPMFSTTTKTFGTLDVLARVEWHPPDFLNSAVHRGVTLYEPI